ncbi:NYN domain-containing protein [Trichothermofontia sp.]
MDNESHFKNNKLAVLIDAENISPKSIDLLFREIAKYGTIHVRRIYGDWTTPQLSSWKDQLHKYSIQPIQQFRYTSIQQFRYTSGKNATDSALIIDAMDLLYTRNFDGFCLVSSDSDFTRLVSRIREEGLIVYGFGEKKTPQAFVSACDKFIYLEILTQKTGEVASNSSINPEESVATKSLRSSDKEAIVALQIPEELLELLKDAYEAVSGEDGWANLGPFGAQITRLSPSFDARTYGFKKLGELVRKINIFEVKQRPKGLYIKLKEKT